jgi:hypothetical protein
MEKKKDKHPGQVFACEKQALLWFCLGKQI